METPVYACRRTEPFEVDADLSKSQWKEAEAVPLLEALTGKEPRYPTEARMLYDERYLYASFHCVDEYVWADMTERDSLIYNEEAVELFIDPGKTGFAYYEIELSPRNVVFDLFVLNAGRSEKEPFMGLAEWDCRGLKTAVRIEGRLNSLDGTDKSWDAELAIPFEAMIGSPHVPPRPGDEWRINLYRIERPEKTEVENTCWSPTLKADFHVAERFGVLRFE